MKLQTTLLFLGLLSASSYAQKPAPDFNRDVRPILANHCLKCHGPDDKQRQAGFRLDRSPGVAALKKALNRIQRPTGDALKMPPEAMHKPLSATQQQTLKQWVVAGGKYEPHWAFVRPNLPRTSRSTTAEIDRLIQQQLRRVGLRASPEADRYTLLRRVSFDLTGLPPSVAEVQAFLADKSPNAYERVVDRLLKSPHYGERWARKWLDLARYADTNGYEKDKPRSIWPYRDWVINAINSDMPFDQFTIKQLAGDLLPKATLSDRVATGFHRNTMLNEEGGIDPLEYRFLAMTDRMATTGSTWLGLTLGCAQCHTHKYDPITHTEYYRMMAFLDNTEEPEIDVVTASIKNQQDTIDAEVAKREAALAEVFSVEQPFVFATSKVSSVQTQSGATATVTDSTVLIGGMLPETDTYTIMLAGPETPISTLRLETLTDPTLGNRGPGRTPHGNFVLTEITVAVDGKPVALTSAQSDAAQDGFPASAAIDNNPKTGWAIQGPGNWNVDRTATFTLAKPTRGTTWTVTLRQEYGGKHTIGKFRLSLGAPAPDSQPGTLEEKRRQRRDEAFARWTKEKAAQSVRWSVVRPSKATSNLPLLTLETDDSVFVSGDLSKRDVYELSFDSLPKGVTAIRLDALPDERLPKHGPGRVYYEGPHGDFLLSELKSKSGNFARSYTNIGSSSSALDNNPQTGWSINGSQGKPSTAVFVFEKPLASTHLDLSMIFEHYYAAGLGKFRISVTTAPLDHLPTVSPQISGDAELALSTPPSEQTAAQKALLFREFLLTTPKLARERDTIDALRRSAPQPPTTLVFSERPANNPRKTWVRNRGEYLQPTVAVTPAVLSVLNPLSPSSKRSPNRLDFARWIVARENPLTARVVVNRAWAAFFGRGIVKTTEDFGYQGDPPTHPELLDRLAIDFMQDGWSMKRLHRAIVMSATYRQSSVRTAAQLARDPENRWLSVGPRLRLDAEELRDSALAVSGLLSRKLLGPSVFPPQPSGVTTDGAYGALDWIVSSGEDRYRRGLYTFSKRTAPYAMFTTFDAPSGEAACPRRESTNTPLQALTLLNDPVFVEAAQALGKLCADDATTPAKIVQTLFQRVVSRPATQAETDALIGFYTAQKARITRGELDPTALCGHPNAEWAAWTTVARVILNVDEAIVRR